jgi:hypothetical protein
MASQRILVPEWRDENKDSRYPFSDSSTLEGDNGSFLDKDIFLDAVIYAIGAEGPFYLRSIQNDNGVVTITINNETNTAQITGVATFSTTTTGIELTDSNGNPAGLLVYDYDRAVRLQNTPIGSVNFNDTAQFVASVVIPMPQNCVSGFILPDGSVVSGEVWFYGENGIVVRQDSDGAIRFDFVGDPLFKRKLCDIAESETALFTTPNFIKTINGIPADTYGNFLLTANNEMAGDSILRVYPNSAENVVKIELVGQTLEGVQ